MNERCYLEKLMSIYVNSYHEYAKPKKNAKKQPKPKNGQVFAMGSLFYVVTDNSKYPYEVLLCSPFCEFATDEDLIVKGKDFDCWLVEGVVGYATHGHLAASVEHDFIVESIQPVLDLVHGKRKKVSNIPDTKWNLMFKELERKRSLIFSPFVSAFL